MKTSDLAGAQLDYWTARAEGIPAEQLAILPIQRSEDHHCVRTYPQSYFGRAVMAYSTDWTRGGPLIEKHQMDLCQELNGTWVADDGGDCLEGGSTVLVAVCRAVVQGKFGDEVPDV